MTHVCNPSIQEEGRRKTIIESEARLVYTDFQSPQGNIMRLSPLKNSKPLVRLEMAALQMKKYWLCKHEDPSPNFQDSCKKQLLIQ